MIPAESFEELSEIYLEGVNPKYFYDEGTDTYFRNKELIAKSKEYREYELSLERRKKFWEDSINNANIPNEAIVRTQKIIKYLKECEKCKQKENGFISGNTDSVWISNIQGSIDSQGYNVGHAWNAIMINGKLKYVDISSAIHCKDKNNTINLPEDFFGKTFEELKIIDGGKNRKIAEGFKKVLKN